MKKIIIAALICIGCSSSPPASPVPGYVEPPHPEKYHSCPMPTCGDKVFIIDSSAASDLTCPPGSKMTLPNSWQAGKLVILCQCQ